MSQNKDPEHHGASEQPETAFEEVLREIEHAENRTQDSPEQRRHRGEAADATTPNTRAQEESEGEQ
ncbi:hypothetical protein [Streptomyces viridochromogenes]|uniref:hypothetical protein n=1 Tax=Streptomyces viridochromogenes TaxID=1938 RepID=UPI0001B4D370|nr:hypothetical protein [Streptomyces viridochromogenes]